MMKIDENADECHQGLEFYESPVSRTEEAQDQKFHTIKFTFSCNPVYIYMFRNFHDGGAEFLDHEVSPSVDFSIDVESRDLNNWEEAREELDELLEDYATSYLVRDELTSFAVDTAKDVLLSSGGHRFLHLHIPFDVVHEHIFDGNPFSSGRVSTTVE